jgi:ketosteroid isomerase-like protein
MSGENVRIVRHGLELFLCGEVDAALEKTTPSVVAVRHAPLPDPQIYHGTGGLRQMWSDWTTDFDRFEMTVGAIADLGDRVLAEVLQRGTGRRSGVEVEGRFWFLYTLDEGRVSRLDAFGSPQQAMARAARRR